MALNLLDTTALIDLSKGFEPTTSWITEQSSSGEEFGASPITIAEFYSGLTVAQRPTWDEFFAALTFCPISYEASVQAGKWRAEYRSRGIQLSTTDALVAAVAADLGAIVVTSNVKHYPMPVRLIDPLSSLSS
jgi:predicted nucleic acid-binding protein